MAMTLVMCIVKISLKFIDKLKLEDSSVIGWLGLFCFEIVLLCGGFC